MSSGVKILRSPRHRHICLGALGKYACNAINALQVHVFGVPKMCLNEYLLYCCETTGTPSHYKNLLVEILHILKNDKYVR